MRPLACTSLAWQAFHTTTWVLAMSRKSEFQSQLTKFVSGLQDYVSTDDDQWTVKGFIDVFQTVYTISSDTKIVSKSLEIHIFPKILSFARECGYKVVLAEHQNYYPDVSFVKADDDNLIFVVDFKTTYRNPDKPHLCNGFTLGSHGKYFEERTSTKNIQFLYADYTGHYCLGIIYDRIDSSAVDDTRTYGIDQLESITSVVRNFQFFVVEKWRIASDKGGSGNTANIGSIGNIDDILNGRGMFSKLGEDWFDDYWMNYQKITVADAAGRTKKISNLADFVAYRGGDPSLIVAKRR